MGLPDLFRVIRVDFVLRFVAIATVAISMGIYFLVQRFLFPDLGLFRVVLISSIVSAILVFLLLMPSVSRRVWAIASQFDSSIFPDLNGTWEGLIYPEPGREEIPVRAVIRQSLLTTQIDLHGESIKSTTLETTPLKDQGQNKMHYVYRAVPKHPQWSSYEGSTMFDVRTAGSGKKRTSKLSGRYYTDRKTIGRISLTQTSSDPSVDVSYY